jgi:prepilin signal peptidase PulO-like enzyme (type II secretory pathway)
MVLWFHKTGFAPPFQAFIILLIAFLALALALSDYYYQIIPDQFLIGLIILGLLLNYQSIITFIPGVLAGTVAFYLLHALFSGQALGFGDVKYVFTMGLILPWPHLIMAIYLAFLTGGIVSVILILAGKKGLKSTISFGPFLTFGLLAGLWQII